MDSLSELEQALQRTLRHLGDSTYQPDEGLCRLLGCTVGQGADAVRDAIWREIAELRPSTSSRAGARAQRLYDVLTCRYVEGLTQDEAAERLCITPRHLRREQRLAVSAFARHLWRRAQSRLQEVSPDSMDGGRAPEWISQVHEELVALQRGAPGAVANVAETVQAVVRLAQPIVSRYGLTLRLGVVLPDLVVEVNPSSLRQILLSTVTTLARHMAVAEITLSTGWGSGQVQISLIGRPGVSQPLPEDPLVRELLAAQGGSCEMVTDASQVSMRFGLPPAHKLTALVVDDNPDIVHCYQRYTSGTRYRVESLDDADKVWERIETAPPDLIILDVMLPGTDGWELLSRLHEHPVARSIPVVVCTVVRDSELALALGATAYLPKPVRRADLIQVLDEVSDRVAATGPAAPANSAATG